MTVGIAAVLDELCTLICAADEEHRDLRAVHLPPPVYDAVATAKRAQHVDRGDPLLLLGLDLVRDESLGAERVRVR